MFREINNWRRWGAGDELGTMNLVTAQKVREAAALVRRGITVSLAHNPMPDEAPDNPAGAFKHTMGASRRTDTYEFTYPGSDAATDVTPSRVQGVVQPVHTMLLAGFGTNIFDNMDLEAVAEAAATEAGGSSC
jgi:hypothetical protein